METTGLMSGDLDHGLKRVEKSECVQKDEMWNSNFAKG